MNYFLSPTLDFAHECKEGNWIFSTWQRHQGSPGEGCILKFGRYFSLVGIAKSYFLSPPLDFSHEFKEGSWIFSTWQRHRGSPGEGYTLKFGRYFSSVGIAMSYFLSLPLDFYHEFKEGSWIFSTWPPLLLLVVEIQWGAEKIALGNAHQGKIAPKF